jgi:hypothetical protein
MSKTAQKISWFGIVLIVIGLAMLLDRFDVFNLRFSTIFWPMVSLCGLVLVGRGYAQERRGRVFWGTVLFLYGIFFVLRSIDYFEIYGYTFFPASFLVFGLAFFMMYLCNFRDWPLLIPSMILLGIGSLILMNEYGFLYPYEVFDIIHMYWPVALILFGVGLMLRKKYPSTQQANPPTPAPPPAM